MPSGSTSGSDGRRGPDRSQALPRLLGVSLGHMMKNSVQTWPMRSPSPLEQSVAAHGRELAVLRGLLDEAARDTAKLCEPRGRAPKGTAMSALTRDKFLELAEGCTELAASRVAVKPCGEDWVRVWLPELQIWMPLRHRPETVVLVEQAGLLSEEDEDLLGWPGGSPVLFWRWNHAKHRLSSYSVAWVTSKKKWFMECPVREEIEISADLMALPVGGFVPTGARNDDDDLPGVVTRWDTAEPLTEDQATDKADEGAKDEGTNPAVGEDGN